MTTVTECFIKRYWFTEQSTIGELFIGPARECFTLEDTKRPDGVKVAGKTCIPAGRYELRITWSPKFECYMPELQRVPNYSGIRLHWGNVPGDTLGCVLVGEGRGIDSITHSVVAYRELLPKLEALGAREPGRVFVTITNEEQLTC